VFVTAKIITLLLTGLVVMAGSVWPAVAAEVENIIGVIMGGDIPYYEDLHSAFMSKLGREGVLANSKVLSQKPYPDDISLSNAARKLIAQNVNVIVAYGTSAAAAVK
jgi:ABC-type sugar transport system substrate-binding protein